MSAIVGNPITLSPDGAGNYTLKLPNSGGLNANVNMLRGTEAALLAMIPGNLAAQLAYATDTGNLVLFAGGNSTGVLLNTGGAKSGLYLPSGWNSAWKAKLALASSGLARIAVVGDSIVQGGYASDNNSKPWIYLMRNSLQALYPAGGSGFRGSVNSIVGWNNSTYTGNGGVSASLATLTGTWVMLAVLPEGPGATVLEADTVGATYTDVVQGTQVDVYFLTTSTIVGGQINVTIDGVAQGATSTNTGALGIGKRTFSGLASGNHVVTITAVDANGTTIKLFFIGMSGSNGNGVIVDNYGRGSFPSYAYANRSGLTGAFTNSGGTTYGNNASYGAYGMAGQWSGGSKNGADLIIYSMGINDSHGSPNTPTTPSQYFSNVRDYLQDVMDGGTKTGKTSILLMSNFMGQLSFQDAATKYYKDYVRQLNDMAAVYGCAHVNIDALLNNSWNNAQALGYMGNVAAPGAAGSDVVHYSDAGHAYIASIMTALCS